MRPPLAKSIPTAASGMEKGLPSRYSGHVSACGPPNTTNCVRYERSPSIKSPLFFFFFLCVCVPWTPKKNHLCNRWPNSRLTSIRSWAMASHTCYASKSVATGRSCANTRLQSLVHRERGARSELQTAFTIHAPRQTCPRTRRVPHLVGGF